MCIISTLNLLELMENCYKYWGNYPKEANICPYFDNCWVSQGCIDTPQHRPCARFVRIASCLF